MSLDFDVAIVGLGPAGALLAARLSPTLEVLAVDKKQARGEASQALYGTRPAFSKPCGGMLAPDAQKAFSRFGMTLPKDVLVNPQIFSVRTIDLQSGLTRHYQRHYINMDRHRFDHWLMSHIPNRVEVRRAAAVTGVHRLTDGGFELTFEHGGHLHRATARYVVGADGAASPVRRALLPALKPGSYMAIQQWFSDDQPSPAYACFFDRRLTPSYAWGLSKDGAFILGGAFPLEGARRRLDALKAALPAYGFHLGEPLKTEACLVLRPFGLGGRCCGEGGVFLAGEAAGFISPTSLEGISYALESGWLLSQCLNRAGGDPNARYRAATRPLRLRLLGKYMKYPFMYAPLLRRAVMASGLQAIDMID